MNASRASILVLVAGLLLFVLSAAFVSFGDLLLVGKCFAKTESLTSSSMIESDKINGL